MRDVDELKSRDEVENSLTQPITSGATCSNQDVLFEDVNLQCSHRRTYLDSLAIQSLEGVEVICFFRVVNDLSRSRHPLQWLGVERHRPRT